MKKVFKNIGWLLLIALIVIQFFHPKKNIQQGDQSKAYQQSFMLFLMM